MRRQIHDCRRSRRASRGSATWAARSTGSEAWDERSVPCADSPSQAGIGSCSLTRPGVDDRAGEMVDQLGGCSEDARLAVVTTPPGGDPRSGVGSRAPGGCPTGTGPVECLAHRGAPPVPSRALGTSSKP